MVKERACHKIISSYLDFGSKGPFRAIVPGEEGAAVTNVGQMDRHAAWAEDMTSGKAALSAEAIPQLTATSCDTPHPQEGRSKGAEWV